MCCCRGLPQSSMLLWYQFAKDFFNQFTPGSFEVPPSGSNWISPTHLPGMKHPQHPICNIWRSCRYINDLTKRFAHGIFLSRLACAVDCFDSLRVRALLGLRSATEAAIAGDAHLSVSGRQVARIIFSRLACAVASVYCLKGRSPGRSMPPVDFR